ncbi:MAG: hypothetical protein Q4D17_11150 [Planctomycetia bacterium]|nr:hypothetical protein [Planctomycetia bacterium]
MWNSQLEKYAMEHLFAKKTLTPEFHKTFGDSPNNKNPYVRANTDNLRLPTKNYSPHQERSQYDPNSYRTGSCHTGAFGVSMRDISVYRGS